MAGDAPMNRLIQGDVGSGKTGRGRGVVLGGDPERRPGGPDGPHGDFGRPAPPVPLPAAGARPHHRGAAHRVGKGGGEEKNLRGAGRRPHPAGHRHPRPHRGQGGVPGPGAGHHRRTAPVRGGAALGIGPEGHLSPPAGDERHPHPPHPGADGVRRPGHLHSGRAAPGPAEDRDLPHRPGKAPAGLWLCEKNTWTRAGRDTSSALSSTGTTAALPA